MFGPRKVVLMKVVILFSNFVRSSCYRETALRRSWGQVADYSVTPLEHFQEIISNWLIFPQASLSLRGLTFRRIVRAWQSACFLKLCLPSMGTPLIAARCCGVLFMGAKLNTGTFNLPSNFGTNYEEK